MARKNRHSQGTSARKAHHPSRAGRRRRGRNLGLWILAGIVLALAFYYIDRSGGTETLDALVVETGTYTHTTRTGGAHTHTEATVEYEGHRYTVRPADNLRTGETVRVNIRRGRITGYPYFDAALGARGNRP